ncbi:hypothetical protein Q428_15250 [Fervidicella metallireducens AeB]|uniref:Uncharacterized protein n=1 Tax=Fervidicella metallireducens AeB TaxID=1403537 RepID=A0A017RRP4_9CLOT|nr:hypothetical protein [Fervidicella metallireducens]EYE87114.1 hypothetical protein Q428_15250 [Fervidicella metallireducens AeB]
MLTTVSNQPKSLDNKAFKFTGSAASRKYIYQTVNVSGKAGDAIILGGWVKGDSVPLVSGRKIHLHPQ